MFRFLACGRSKKGVRERQEKQYLQTLQAAEDAEEERLLQELSNDVAIIDKKQRDKVPELLERQKDLELEWAQQREITEKRLEALTKVRQELEEKQKRQQGLLDALSNARQQKSVAETEKQQKILDAEKNIMEQKNKAIEDYNKELETKLQITQQDLDAKYEELRIKMTELQDKLKNDVQDLPITAFGTSGKDKILLDTLENTLKTQTQALTEKSVAVQEKEKEIERLKKLLGKHRKPQDTSTDAEHRTLPAASKPRRAVKDSTELRVRTQRRCPGFEVFGRELDTWLLQTQRNVSACCRSFRTTRQTQSQEEQYDVMDGELGKFCCCATGAHNRKKCPVCRLLDLSDAALLP